MENLSNKFVKSYELLERIGTGGFGAVYRAHQSTIGREVAIKFILPGFANHPDFIRRFETESHVIARLEHPYIVPLYDYWRDPDGAYLVMRWLRGGSLRGKLQRDGALTPETAAIILDNIASALTLAHRHNVIHRDIKPGNILLDEDENAYLADFGIAKDLTDLNSGNTGADDIVGSLDYLSPEQARSQPVTPRTDIYSLGVMLYEMLVGKHPFHESSSVERLYKHINEPLPELSILDLSIRGAVDEVIQKATEKNPEHRYQDVMQFAADFRKAINATDHIASQLTQREYDVLVRLVDGLSNKQIADEMFIAVSTVKTYINQLYSKLGVRSRVQATLRAHELDLLSSGIPQTIPIAASDSYLPEPTNPYKGLRAFDAADHLDFFGREKLVEKLLDKMREENTIARFLAVIGPSGSGKSSVVKAGLIPAIWNGRLRGSDRWFTVEMLPDVHPMEELEVALTRISANSVSNLDEHLWRDNRGLLRASKLILPADDTELVLVIDQFEEVFTLVEDEEERQQFLDIILTAVSDARSRVRVVITIRADFYDRPLHYAEFGDLLRSRMETILPLSAHGLERAIVGPAEREHVIFEEGLVAHIVSEMTYQAGALPLLQYALTELFERREGRILTHNAYQEIGGAVGALAKRAESLFSELDDEQQLAAQQMFLRLVTLGEGTGDTRRRTARSELLAISEDAQFMEEVIDLFAAYRMLSLDHDPDTRSPTVEVAHEAILGQWDRLRQWININREEIKMQQQLSRMAEEWLNANKDASYLATGSRLGQMQAWSEQTQVALTNIEKQFLLASVQETQHRKQMEESRKEREAALEQRAVQRLRLLVGVFVTSTIIAILLAGFAITQRNEAENARRISEANVIIVQQQANENRSLYLTNEAQEAARNGDTLLALALSVEAVRVDSTSEQANQGLKTMMDESPAIRRFVGHDAAVTAIAFSPDSTMAVSGSASPDNTLILWNLATGDIIHRFEGHSNWISDVAFSPDGSHVVSSSGDNTLILWDVTTGEMIRRFEGHTDNVRSVAFSPDGKSLLSGSCSVIDKNACTVSEVILWDVATGTALQVLNAHENFVTSISFSKDSQYALTASNDSVMLWEYSNNQLLESARLFENFKEFESAEFHIYEATVIATLRDGIVVEQRIGGVPTILHEGNSNRSTVSIKTSFDPNMKVFATTSSEQLIIRCISACTLNGESLLAGDVLAQYTAHTDRIREAKFSPDGHYLLTGSNDKTLILWDMQDPDFAFRTFEGHKNETMGLAISPDGQMVIGGGAVWNQSSSRLETSGDNSIILWDAETGNIIKQFEPVEMGIVDIAISPDGETLVAATGNYSVGVWDIASGELLNQYENMPAFYHAISPDGKLVISGQNTYHPVLWKLQTGEIVHTFAETAPFTSPVAFSPDNKHLAYSTASANDETDIILWNVDIGSEIQRFEGLFQPYIIRFSPDGQLLAVSTHFEGILIFDVQTGEVVREFPNYNGNPLAYGLAFSADGQYLLSSWGTSDVVLWNIETGQATLVGRHGDVVWQVAFIPDGTAVSSSWNGTIKMWAMGGEQLISAVEENRYIRDFTCGEREEYRIEPLCEATETEG